MLNFNHNKLTIIDFSYFDKLVHLKYLYLSHNLLSSVIGFDWCHLTELLYIDLSNNFLMTLPFNFFENSKNINHINLNNNYLKYISNSLSKELPSVSRLEIQENPLLDFKDRSQMYPNLKRLSISGSNLNNITRANFGMHPKLIELILINNQISHIAQDAFENVANIKNLDLSSNLIKMIPIELKNLHQLRLLNFSHNQIDTLEEISYVKYLITLDLSKNKINTISIKAFKNMKHLEELYLQDNNIDHLKASVFISLAKLKKLDLHGNNLKAIPVEIFVPIENTLIFLDITDNTMDCNCETRETWEWLHNHPRILKSQNHKNMGPYCYQTKIKHPISLLETMPNQFCDKPYFINLTVRQVELNSMVLGWHVRSHSGQQGFIVSTREMNQNSTYDENYTDPKTNTFKLNHLEPETWYEICVYILSNWDWTEDKMAVIMDGNNSQAYKMGNKYFNNSIFSICLFSKTNTNSTKSINEVKYLSSILIYTILSFLLLVIIVVVVLLLIRRKDKRNREKNVMHSAKKYSTYAVVSNRHKETENDNIYY
ncbi:uncharacterized protein LOC143919287 [Arctopsyche grandis]|uniref:uncharacterized protein LOC143919287 n=1 Tax=Arctopsyche grandis TaxID=121162 RepID=UPI00406D827A